MDKKPSYKDIGRVVAVNGNPAIVARGVDGISALIRRVNDTPGLPGDTGREFRIYDSQLRTHNM